MNRPRFTIRTARIADEAALTALITASYEKLYAGWYSDDVLAVALPHMSRAQPKLLNSGTYFVVEDDGRPVGCGGWTAEEPARRKRRSATRC